MKNTSTLVEFLLVAHLKLPLNPNVLALGEWINNFSSRFPQWEQMNAGPRVDLQQSTQPSFAFATAPEAPRIVMRAPDGQQLLLQGDRVGLGWMRQIPLGGPAQYHGFEFFQESFSILAREMTDWFRAISGTDPEARLVELLYRNAVPLDRDGKRLRLSDVVRVINVGRGINQLAVHWTELLAPSLAAPRVQVSLGLGTAPPDLKVLAFDLVGLGPIDCRLHETPFQSVAADLHASILDIRGATLTSTD